MYQSSKAVLLSKDGFSEQQPNYVVAYSITADTEHSANSEGSHETGDSGRFSHESDEELQLSPNLNTTSGAFEGNDLHAAECSVLSAPEEPPDQSPPRSVLLPLVGRN